MRLRTSILAAAGIMLAAAAHAEPEVYAGGKNGDYYRHFCPQVVSLASAATWQEYGCVETAGTPDNMERLLGNPDGVAELQGNVYAALAAAEPEKYGPIKIVAHGFAREIIFAVVRPQIAERAKGSWNAIADKAQTLRFATAGENSGPGYTMRQFIALDPRLKADRVTYVSSKDGGLDSALQMLTQNKTDVVLVAQFANPENPRFDFIAENGLAVVGIMFPQMRDLAIPLDGGASIAAFDLCQGVTVGYTGGVLGFGQSATTLTTACTPMLIGVNRNGPADLEKTFAAAEPAALLPASSGSSGFLASLSAMQVVASEQLSGLLAQAQQLGNEISSKM